MILSKHKVLCDPRREINSIWRREYSARFHRESDLWVELWRISHWPLEYLKSIVSVAIFIIFPFHTSHLSQTHISDSLERNNWFYHSSLSCSLWKMLESLDSLSFPFTIKFGHCGCLKFWIVEFLNINIILCS